MHSLIVFASGTGTNTTAIINYFKNSTMAKVSLIVSNNANAGVLEIAKREHIPFLIINKESIHEALIVDQLQSYNPSLIILSGFLWKIPLAIINAFRHKIINIHPALLPKYGGQGMYGAKVHNAVIESEDKQSGITIHYVDEFYDHGGIIMQAYCDVKNSDTMEDLAQRIHTLEHFFFPRTIELLLLKSENQLTHAI